MASSSLSLAAVVNLLREAGLLIELHGSAGGLVSGVSQDSRSIEPGDLFLAWEGVDHDAHDFLHDVVEAGACAAVVEKFELHAPIPQMEVADGRRAAAIVADAFHGSPWKSLVTVGVTGTNGKTTTVVLSSHLLKSLGATAAIGTLGLMGPDGTVRPGTESLTTPGPVTISGWLRELADEGVCGVAIEASSHALSQARLEGMLFDVAVFTNLGRDHLDYHRDQSDYLAAKAHLLELVKPGGAVLVNADEPEWQGLPETDVRRVTFGVSPRADLRADRIVLEPTGSRFTLQWNGARVDVESPLLGAFNVENTLASSGVALLAGVSLHQVGAALRDAPSVSGRMETLQDHPYGILIDFAHTPDALRKVLETIRPLVRGRLIVVFGAGGDRDKAKRPAMGMVAAELADLAVVTSDNPRTEDPEEIIDQIVAGIGAARFERIGDRREAIERALEIAEPGDVVLLAGKGHERYQVLGRERVPFDEREVVRELLAVGGES